MPSSESKFHAVFEKIWPNRMLAPPPPPQGWRLHPGEILDPPLSFQQNNLQNNSLLPNLRLEPPVHLGNPGSATVLSSLSVCVLVLVTN